MNTNKDNINKDIKIQALMIAASLPEKHIQPTITPDDMEQDPNGEYAQSGDGEFYKTTNHFTDKRYRLKETSTPEKRLVRQLNKIANEIINQL